MKRDTPLFVTIVGCGRLGSHLADRLSRKGHSVVVIDPEEAAFGLLSAEYSGFRVEGDATEFAVLKRAKADQADVLVASTNSDNVNLMVAQVASRLLGVPHVVARVVDPARSDAFANSGIEVLCPTSLAADLLVDRVLAKSAPAASEAAPQ
jgi:trk system potassium uptake protein TrkA